MNAEQSLSSDSLDEINEQPEALRRAVARYPGDDAGLRATVRDWQAGQYDRVILTGMGSSLHSSYPLALALNRAAVVPVQVWDASELVHFAPQTITRQTLLIVVSQSGESAELKHLPVIGHHAARTLAITNGPDNSLGRWADITIQTHAGPERAFSTKTYTSTLAVLHLLGRQLLQRSLSDASEQLLEIACKMEILLGDAPNLVAHMSAVLGLPEALVFLGRGPSLASARTGALITGESSKLLCFALSSGQFRHGPLELVREGFRAVLFTGDDEHAASALNSALAADIERLGGRVLVISERVAFASARQDYLALPPTPAALLPILEIIPIQLLATALAGARGFAPSTFVNARKVTVTE